MTTIERPSALRGRPVARPTRPDEPILTLDLDRQGPVPLITVRGEVDLSTAHLISELAEDVIAGRPARLVLDLFGVTFFSAHGISALLRIQHSAASAGVTLTLLRTAPCVTYLMAVTDTRINSEVTRTGIGP
jgi:anti-anti-sigma factor